MECENLIYLQAVNLIRAFVARASGVVKKKLSLSLMLRTFVSTISSRSFTVLGLLCKSLPISRFFFLTDVLILVQFHSFAYEYSNIPAPFIEKKPAISPLSILDSCVMYICNWLFITLVSMANSSPQVI